MKILKDIFKLIVLLLALAVVFYGLYHLTSSEERQKKYVHPITRPGAGW